MKEKQRSFFVTKIGSMILVVVMLLVACSKDGDIIYQPDPDEPKGSTAPLVTVIYSKDALGDRSYNDLIYKGVEEAAADFHQGTVEVRFSSEVSEKDLKKAITEKGYKYRGCRKPNNQE